MFTKGGIVYADAYKYLKHKTMNVNTFSSIGSIEDYNEVDITLPINFVKNGDIYIFEGGELAFRFSKTDYTTVKTELIKKRYSNDDQIAIMLNREQSEEDEIYYNKMQEWRDFAGFVAKSISDNF